MQLAHVEELEDFVEQAKQFGVWDSIDLRDVCCSVTFQPVANWMYYVKRFNHPNFIAFITANKGL